MGWLDKKNEKEARKEPVYQQQTARSTPVEHQVRDTVIGPKVRIEGKVEAANNVLIHGLIVGEIHCKDKITVAESGKIDGAVECGEIDIFGEVKGDVISQNQITIESSGRLTGDISTKVFTNQPGGFFEGYSHMLTDKPKPGSAGKEKGPADKGQSPAGKDKGSGEGQARAGANPVLGDSRAAQEPEDHGAQGRTNRDKGFKQGVGEKNDHRNTKGN